MTAYGAETSSGFVQAATVRDLDPNIGVGLGVASSGKNTNSPNHAIDNYKYYSSTSTSTSGGGADYAEILAINFSEAIQLTSVSTSWTWNDSDAQIFRWDGTGNPFSNMLSLSPDALLADGLNLTNGGWNLVASGQFSTTVSLSVTNDRYSSYWLVSTALGQSTGADGKNKNNDAFKIDKFAGTVCAYTVTNGQCTPPGGGGPGGNVPEPGTLALATMALLGTLGVRRRRGNRDAT